MSDYLLTAKGTILPEWYDRNNHMNVVYYLSLFDQAAFKLLEGLSMDKKYIVQNDITLVAGRIYTAHKKEMFNGDNFEIHSGFVNYSETYVTITNRMKRDGVLVASCDMRMNPIRLSDRTTTKIPQALLEQCEKFHIKGLKDIFEDTL